MLKEGINEIKIESYDELINIICGKHENYKDDLREKFIFRGLSNVKYELIPSSLRKNNLNQLKIDEIIEENKKFLIEIDENEVIEKDLECYESEIDYKKKFYMEVDKYGKPTSDKNIHYNVSKKELQNEKESYILQKFFNYADKCGLKVNTNNITRDLIHPSSQIHTELEEILYDYTEIISLAQHYGLPTGALDWSYDYKVALYFAVRDILSNSHAQDCVLWALNYKFFEHQLPSNEYIINLKIYRPEYNTNPNLTAQKGLFTFLGSYIGDYESPLDKIISNELKHDIKDRTKEEYRDKKIITVPPYLSSKDTVFYKFIIPKELKSDILNELYLDGYSEEYLFPGYKGVSKHIINEVKLEKLLKESKTFEKNILLSANWNIDKVKNKEKLFEFIRHDFECKINKIFIYQNQEVIGYFKGNEVIKDTCENLWNKFGKQSGISRREFNDTFKDCDCFAIRINDLNLFKYPIKLCEFKLNDDFCYIKENDENLNFLLNFT
jgi:predicted transcriptional regulator